MSADLPPGVVPLSLAGSVWERFHAVAPLVLVATLDPDGAHDVAPKHMAMPLGWDRWFCFVCSPRHTTYANTLERGCFTVGYPGPGLVVETALAASPREPDAAKPALAALETFPATAVEGVLVAGCDAYVECELDRMLDGYGDNSLVIGRVVAAAAREQVLRDPERDDADVVQQAGLLAYVHPGRYAEVRETRAFPFPAGFHT